MRPVCTSPRFAGTFNDPSVVAAYRHRPPQPPATLAILRRLIVDEPRSVLDAGTGLGDVARELAPDRECTDTVDFSERMIEAARSLPGGDDPRIRGSARRSNAPISVARTLSSLPPTA